MQDICVSMVKVGVYSGLVFGCLLLSTIAVLGHFDDDFVQEPLYSPPVARGNVYFTEAFISEKEFRQRWIKSEAKKDFADDSIAKYDGQWSLEKPKDVGLNGDLGLVLKSKAKHHAISVALNQPFVFNGSSLVVQYEVKFQNGMDCGGAYMKLITHEDNLDLRMFADKMPYAIMFGPDKCGNNHKVHFIFQHRNPLTGAYEEKHANKPNVDLSTYFNDKKTHLYTLVLNPDNSFQVYIDHLQVNQGSLLHDMSPPVNPPKEVINENDSKPTDWDEREKIPDPNAVKPENWDDEPELIPDVYSSKPEGWLDDEPEFIPDKKAQKPADWDDELDGEWEPPKISNPKCDLVPGCGEWIPPKVKNPKYKGKWSPPMIANPNYKGKWSPRMMPNPNFFEDKNPYRMAAIGALGLELWSMSNDILFDNFIITDKKRVADLWANDSWALKHALELEFSAAQRSFGQVLMDAIEERPWLLIVLIFVVVIPGFFFIVCCCATNPQLEEDAKRKKTDVPTAGATRNHRYPSKEDQATEYTNILRSNEDATKTTHRKGKSSLETNRF